MLRKTLLWLAALVTVPGIAHSADYTLITLLHTNDLHGSVIPEDSVALGGDVPASTASPGGYGLAKIATLVRGIRKEMPHTLLVDTGDVIHGSYEDYFSGGVATITAMNAVGYDAGVTGNHEFDFGLQVTENALRTATHPMLAANIRDVSTGEVWNGLKPYQILTVGDVRVGILGLATVESVTLQWPPSVAGIKVEDPFTTAKALVPEIRKNADVVVVASHLGYRLDLDIAKKVKGIDFIIGGHTHTVVDKWQWVGDTLVVQAGAYGKYLGRIDFIVANDGARKKIMSVNGKGGRLWNDMSRSPLGIVYPTSPLVAIPPSTADDPAVVAAYKPFREDADALLDQVIGDSTEEVTTVPSPSGETAAANLAADAVRALGKADIGIVDAKSVAAGLNQGPLTRRQAFDMIGGFTRQQVIVAKFTGSDLMTALTAKLVKVTSLRLQVSGMTLSFSSKIPGKVSIGDVMVGGMPIDPAREYSVATQAYVVQSLMQSAPGAVVIGEAGGTTREALVDYVRAAGTIVSPGVGRISRR
jgi:5'-nucleotidase